MRNARRIWAWSVFSIIGLLCPARLLGLRVSINDLLYEDVLQPPTGSRLKKSIIMKFHEIRRQFLDHYANSGFTLLPRASMLHPSIPMSFVMSAGLVQIETSLANAADRSGNRFMLRQDCFRHFDINTVGKDDTHLSLFEMLGAFVFGSNHQQEMIAHIWDLATRRLGIDPGRIWVTYFSGGQLDGHHLPEDCETLNAWLALGLPRERVTGLGIGHNFWQQGGSSLPTGAETAKKCGPNTELFYDRGTEHACGRQCRPGCGCARFVEFSNSLFISHELDPAANQLRPLADPFAETVIGVERVGMILQQVPSVFNTTHYHTIIDTLETYRSADKLPDHLTISSKRVLVDYLRALCVLVSDGAPPPGKNGRERIIRLLVRGILTRKAILKIKGLDFLPTLIEQIVTIFHYSHIDLSTVTGKIDMYIASEASRFNKTIRNGKNELEQLLSQNQGETLTGPQIVYLEKEKGLPHLLTASELKKKGLSFNIQGYKTELNSWGKQKHH